MVPPVGGLTTTRRPLPHEPEVVAEGARYLAEQGYRTWVDPDGSDYFDLVARRGNEVGLVEAKVSDSRTVLQQALTRRVWGDWVAALLVPLRAAERLEARSRTTRASAVGIWTLVDGRLRVLRPARPWVVTGTADPYAELRERFRGILDALERGEIPEGVAWANVPGSVRRASHGRRFREWRLDEPDPTARGSGGE